MQNNTHSTTPVPTAHPRPYTKLEIRLIALLTEVKEEFDIYKAQIDKVLTELSGETVIMKGSDGNPDYFSDTIGRELQKHPKPWDCLKNPDGETTVTKAQVFDHEGNPVD
tara:strand:- start:42 stop:371 length:330 start_codon:yes stop_codon:yes gene_type:complete